jgi:hypothetical protein
MARRSLAFSLLAPALFLGASLALNGQTAPQQPPPSHWAPLPRNVHTLRIAEIRELLGDHYQLVTSVREIPSVTLTDFANSWGQPFAAVDPGHPMNPDALPGPHRQLVFAAFSRDTAVVVFVSGGFVDTLNVAVFTHAFGGGVWKAVLRDLPTEDIAGLRAALRAGDYVTPDQIQQP